MRIVLLGTALAGCDPDGIACEPAALVYPGCAPIDLCETTRGPFEVFYLAADGRAYALQAGDRLVCEQCPGFFDGPYGAETYSAMCR